MVKAYVHRSARSLRQSNSQLKSSVRPFLLSLRRGRPFNSVAECVLIHDVKHRKHHGLRGPVLTATGVVNENSLFSTPLAESFALHGYI